MFSFSSSTGFTSSFSSSIVGSSGSGVNTGITSPFFTNLLQSRQYVSPVYPSVSVVASFAFSVFVFLWLFSSKSPYSTPHTSQTALFIQVASPPLCPVFDIVVPVCIVLPQSVHTVSPVYPSSVQVASFAFSIFVFLWLFSSKSPYSTPHTSQTALFIQVASPPLCSVFDIVVPVCIVLPQSSHTVSPVYPSS